MDAVITIHNVYELQFWFDRFAILHGSSYHQFSIYPRNVLLLDVLISFSISFEWVLNCLKFPLIYLTGLIVRCIYYLILVNICYVKFDMKKFDMKSLTKKFDMKKHLKSWIIIFIESLRHDIKLKSDIFYEENRNDFITAWSFLTWHQPSIFQDFEIFANSWTFFNSWLFLLNRLAVGYSPALPSWYQQP